MAFHFDCQEDPHPLNEETEFLIDDDWDDLADESSGKMSLDVLV